MAGAPVGTHALNFKMFEKPIALQQVIQVKDYVS